MGTAAVAYARFQPHVSVRITNSQPGHAEFTTAKRAQSFVLWGRAEWVDYRHKAIRLLPIALEIVRRHAARKIRESDTGYDRVGRMTLDQMRGIPIIEPEKLIQLSGPDNRRCGFMRRVRH